MAETISTPVVQEASAKDVAKALDAAIVKWEVGRVHRFSELSMMIRDELLDALVGYSTQEQEADRERYKDLHQFGMGLERGTPARTKAFEERDAIARKMEDKANLLLQNKPYEARIKRRVEKVASDPKVLEVYRFDDEGVYDHRGVPVLAANKEPSYGLPGTKEKNLAKALIVKDYRERVAETAEKALEALGLPSKGLTNASSSAPLTFSVAAVVEAAGMTLPELILPED